MSPKLSIIVPVHNVASFLPTCLNSIVGQGRDDVEVVLVDDRSTDASAAICDDFARRHRAVRAIHLQENGGVGEARNHGLAAATGDYCLFVDGDDCLLPGSLARVSREIERLAPVDLLICHYHSESKVLSNAAMFLDGAAGKKLDAELVLEHLTRSNYYLDHCWPYVISRALIERHAVRFIRSMVAEDAEFIVRILTLASSAAYCEGDFYLYRERDGSLKNARGVAATASFLQVANAMRHFIATAASTETQSAFVTSQIDHTLSAFSARLSLLDAKDLQSLARMVHAEHLPAAIRQTCPGNIDDALFAHRNAADAATLELASAAKGRPIFIYCAGPSAEAVVRTLLTAQHDVRAVVDDNEALNGRSILGVPVVSRSHLAELDAEAKSSALVVICIQKRAAHRRIAASLSDGGFAPGQIVHRVF